MAKKSNKPARRGRRAKGDKSKLKHYRPSKPRKDFPLTPVAGGQWAKRINGRLYYFGRWFVTKDGQQVRLPNDGWEDALALYNAQKDDLYAGREPRHTVQSNELTVKGMCFAFLDSKKPFVDSKELKPATFNEYKNSCKKFCDIVGGDRLVDDLTEADFLKVRTSLSNRLGPVGVGNQIGKMRAIFIHANRQQQVPKTFRKPSAKTMLKHRDERGKKIFDPAEIKLLLENSTGQMHAMILLAINCGMGNTDCSEIELKNIDLDRGWLSFPRPKTGVKRRAKLWPETIAALREVIANRKKAASQADRQLIFLTKYQSRWVRDIVHYKKDANGNQVIEKVTSVNAVSGEFAKVMKACGLNGHRGFYSLRHSYRTAADNCLDQPACDYTMGHTPNANDMASRYRDSTDIKDHRLVRVAATVYEWLYAKSMPNTEDAQ